MLGSGKKSIVPFVAMVIAVMMLFIPKLYAVNPNILQNVIKIGQLALEIFEPRHGISNNVVCTTSKGSDQPGHTRSLIRAFASRLNIL